MYLPSSKWPVFEWLEKSFPLAAAVLKHFSMEGVCLSSYRETLGRGDQKSVEIGKRGIEDVWRRTPAWPVRCIRIRARVPSGPACGEADQPRAAARRNSRGSVSAVSRCRRKGVSIQKIDANVGKGRKRSENVAVLGSGGAGPDRMQGISASLNPLDFPFWNAPRCLAAENRNLSPDHPV